MAQLGRSRSSPVVAAPMSVRLFLRRLRVERQLALVLFVVVLLTALLFAGIPRFYNRMSDEGLAHALRSSTATLANVEMLEQNLFPFTGGTDAASAIPARGAELEGQLPSALTGLFGRREFVAQSAEYHVQLPEGAAAWPQYYIRTRYQSGIDDQIRVVEGRMPAATAKTVPVSAPVLNEFGEATGKMHDVPAPVIEVAISSDAANIAHLRVGDRWAGSLTQPPSVTVNGAAPVGSGHAFVEVVGRFDVVNPDADYWYDDVLLQHANIAGSVDHPEIHVIGLMAAGGYDALLAEQNVVFDFRWRYFVDPERIDAGRLPAVEDAVRQAQTEYPAFVNGFGGTSALRTGLGDIFRHFEAQRRLTEAILAVVTMGLLAVALVVVGLIGALIADRRRAALVLQRGRGASAWQILGAQLTEGLLLTVPAVALAAVAAVLLLPARSSSWSVVAVAGVAVGATLLLVATALPVARRRLGQMGRNDPALGRISVRRLIFEGLVVLLAILGVYLLRRRGLGGTDAVTGFDPFLAAVPVLAGLAAGLVVLRLYPLPIRLFAWLASLGRGFVAVFALRRVGRQPGSSNLPLLVLLLTVAVGVFSSVLLATVERGQTATAWQEVGAPYRARVTFSELPQDLDLGAVSGVEAAARAYFAPGVTFDMNSNDNLVTLDAVQATELEVVTRGTPADPGLPPGILDVPSTANAGTEQAPIPAIISSRAATGPRLMAIDDRFQLLIEGTWINFVVVEVRDSVPGIMPGAPFVVTSFDQLAAARTSSPLPVTNVFIRAPASAEPALNDRLRDVTPKTNLASQAGALGALQGSPLIAGVAAGFRFSLLVAALYSALAVIIALTLTAVARARDLAYLRTLGLSARQSLGLIVVEQVPGVIVALVAGAALGIGVAALIQPGLGLQAFTGATIPVVLWVDWPGVALIGLGLALVVAVAVVVTALLGRRRNLGRAIRAGDL